MIAPAVRPTLVETEGLSPGQKVLVKKWARQVNAVFRAHEKGKLRPNQVQQKVSRIYGQAKVLGLENELRAEVDKSQ